MCQETVDVKPFHDIKFFRYSEHVLGLVGLKTEKTKLILDAADKTMSTQGPLTHLFTFTFKPTRTRKSVCD